MNNEISFRGKRKDNYEWCYGSHVSAPALPFNERKDFIIVFVGIESGEPIFDWHEVISETVGACYGYDDKNFKGIFQGDLIEVEREKDTIVVECKFGTIERQMATGFLCDITGFYFEREDGCQTFAIKKNYKGGHDHKLFFVIGNIHDNPK